MRDLNDAGWSSIGLEPAAAVGTLLAARGFTSEDLKLLQEAHQRGTTSRGWGRGQFAANEFSQYLAIWDDSAREGDPPTLVIVRFDRTGTYALMVRGKIVASAGTLAAILPTLTAPTTGEV